MPAVKAACASKVVVSPLWLALAARVEISTPAAATLRALAVPSTTGTPNRSPTTALRSAEPTRMSLLTTRPATSARTVAPCLPSAPARTISALMAPRASSRASDAATATSGETTVSPPSSKPVSVVRVTPPVMLVPATAKSSLVSACKAASAVTSPLSVARWPSSSAPPMIRPSRRSTL
ncbi:hypothetical protein D9M68_821470 [compost metagenome]